MKLSTLTGAVTPQPWKYNIPASWSLTAMGLILAISALAFRITALFKLTVLLHNALAQVLVFAGSAAAVLLLRFAPPLDGTAVGKLSLHPPAAREIKTLLCALAAIYIGIALVIMPLWEIFLQFFHLNPARTQMLLQMIREADRAEFAALLLTAGILTPAAEELFFRRLLYGLILPCGGTAAAVTTTSVIFAAAHGFLYGFPALFWMGAVFQLTYLKSGNLLCPVILHTVVNTAALTAAYCGIAN